MTVLSCAGFIAEFPDDTIEEEGDIAVFGGRNVAVALGEILRGLGCERVSVPGYDGENGWVFTFDYGQRRSFWCQVTSLHPAYWLLFEGSRSDNEIYRDIWLKFSRVLERDPRFHGVIWRSKHDGPPEEDEIGDELIRDAVRKIPPEPIPEQYRPRPHTSVRVTRAHYAFAVVVSVGYSVPFAIAFVFCAMLVYFGVWWAVFGVLAVALLYWSYLGRSLWGLIRPVGSTVGIAKRSWTPVLIGIWCAMAFVAVPIVDAVVQGSKAQSEYAALVIVALIVSLAGVLRFISRRRASQD